MASHSAARPAPGTPGLPGGMLGLRGVVCLCTGADCAAHGGRASPARPHSEGGANHTWRSYYRIRSPGESLHIAHPLIEVDQAVTAASRGRVSGA